MLAAVNWTQFQHYRHRNPPWVKVHREVIESPAYCRLPVASQALAVRLWVLASKEPEGIIPHSDEDVAFMLRLPLDDFMAAIKPLIDIQFFVSASDVLALRQQSESISLCLCLSSVSPLSLTRDREREKVQTKGSRDAELVRMAKEDRRRQEVSAKAQAASNGHLPPTEQAATPEGFDMSTF